MKKALILVLTMTLLLNTVAFGAMVIPSKTSPDPLNQVNLSDEMFYQELNSYYSDDAYLQLDNGNAMDGSTGATVGATIYKNYLVSPVVYLNVMDGERNKVDIYDLSSNDAFLIDTWTMEDLGWTYKTTDDGVTPVSGDQDFINAMYIDGEYVYLVKLNTTTWRQELYIYTNPLDSEDFLNDPYSVRPTLVSGPTEISTQSTSETFLRGRLAQMTKVGNYLIFAMAKTDATGRTVSYVDVSDPTAPVTSYYNCASLFTYTKANGESVSPAGKIMNVEFKGNIGYFVVSDSGYGTEKWDLIKIDFKTPRNPKVLTGTELPLPKNENEHFQWGATISAANEYIYIATRSEGDWSQPDPAPLIYVVKSEDMSLVSQVSTEFRDGIGDMYDTGDMLICTSGGLRSDGAVVAIRFNDAKTEILEKQWLDIPNNSIKNLQAHCFNILAYGTKLYLAFGEGNLQRSAADPYRAVIGIVDFATFEPYTFTVNTIPTIAYDTYTVTGSIYTAPTAGDVGIHLYINGNQTPVTAEVVPNELGFSINSWSYTFEKAGSYNVIAKLFDNYGDYETMTEEFKVNVVSSTGVNATTEYSKYSDTTAFTVSDTTGTVDYTGMYMGGWDRARVSAVGLSAYDKYIMMPIINITQQASENNSRNVIYFYDTTASNPLSAPVKSYNHAAMGLNTDNSWNNASYPRMIGAYMDDNYLYVLATRTQHFQYNAVDLHIYKNPINKETGAFADNLEKISVTQVLDSFENVKLNDTTDLERYTEIKKITKDGNDYLVMYYPFETAANVTENGIARISVANITDPAAITVTDVNMSTITHNGLSMTYFYDMKFDGNYGYIVGANDGNLNTENATLQNAYFALYKVDFSNPTAPVVVNSWKLCDINYEWLFRASYGDSVRTKVVPSININDGKVMIGIYHTEGFTHSDRQNTGLGSMNAFVVDNDVLTTYATEVVYQPTLKGSAAMRYGTRMMNYVNGTYFATRYLSEHQWGSNFYIGSPSEIANRSTNAGAANTLQSSVMYGNPICSLVVGNKLYQNYYADNEATIVCLDFEDVKSGNKVLKVEAAGDYFATVTVENNGAEITGVPIAALYKDGLLIDTAVGKALTCGEKKTVKSEKLTLTVPTDTDYSKYVIRTFLLGNMTNITPIVSSMSIED